MACCCAVEHAGRGFTPGVRCAGDASVACGADRLIAAFDPRSVPRETAVVGSTRERRSTGSALSVARYDRRIRSVLIAIHKKSVTNLYECAHRTCMHEPRAPGPRIRRKHARGNGTSPDSKPQWLRIRNRLKCAGDCPYLMSADYESRPNSDRIARSDEFSRLDGEHRLNGRTAGSGSGGSREDVPQKGLMTTSSVAPSRPSTGSSLNMRYHLSERRFSPRWNVARRRPQYA